MLRVAQDDLLRAQQQNRIDSSHVQQQLQQQRLQVEQLTRVNHELQNNAQRSAQEAGDARSREQGLRQTINTLTQELAEQKKRIQEWQATRTPPPPRSEVVEDQVPAGMLQSFARNILERLPAIGQGESSSIPASERDKRERVDKLITDIGRLLQSAWKNRPERIKNIEPILANSATIADRKVESVRIPDNATQEQLLSHVVEQVNKIIAKARNPVTLEKFVKYDIPILAELFDKGKQDMRQQDIDAIERGLQEIFPIVDLAEIRIKPYETAYNAHLHDLIKLSSAPSDKKVVPQSTIINSGSRGFTYKGQVLIKPKVIVAE